MGDKIKPRPAVVRFAKDMEIKLKQNDYKNGWQNCDFEYLFRRLRNEADELFYAFHSGLADDRVLEECADVANFAMMISDNIKYKRWERGKKKKSV